MKTYAENYLSFRAKLGVSGTFLHNEYLPKFMVNFLHGIERVKSGFTASRVSSIWHSKIALENRENSKMQCCEQSIRLQKLWVLLDVSFECLKVVRNIYLLPALPAKWAHGYRTLFECRRSSWPYWVIVCCSLPYCHPLVVSLTHLYHSVILKVADPFRILFCKGVLVFAIENVTPELRCIWGN